MATQEGATPTWTSAIPVKAAPWTARRIEPEELKEESESIKKHNGSAAAAAKTRKNRDKGREKNKLKKIK